MKQGYRLLLADGTPVADRVELATGPWSRFCGLMFRRELPPGRALVLRPCSSVHMFFMRFAIDAVFVDAEGRVVRVYSALRPWRMTWVVRRAKACIELPAGTAERCGLGAGSVVRLVEPAEAISVGAPAG